MERFLKKGILVVLTLFLAVSMIACGGGKASGGERPVVVASSEFNGDFYVGWTNSSYDNAIRYLVWRFGLMTETPSGEVADSPLVAEKTVSSDLKVWKFKLVDGVKFHNGEELTASDVKFTYDFYTDKEALGESGGSSSLHDYIGSVEVEEETNTVIFNLKKVPYVVDAEVFLVFLFPEDTIKKGAEEEGLTVQQYVKAHISNPIGYGPYKMVEYKEAEYVKLEAFDGYIGAKPGIKNVIVKVVPGETELDQLLQGEVDMLTGQNEVEKIDAAKADPKFTNNSYFRHGGGTMVLHCDYGPTALTEVRQAFAYVFNRPKLIELFLGPYGIASQGPYSKNMWMLYDDDELDLVGTGAVGRFEASLTNYDILDADGKFDEAANIAKAHELLDAAAARKDGLYNKLTGNGKDGYMWEGKPLDIKVTYTSFWSDTYNLIWNEDYVSKLGFKVSLTGLDWAVMFSHWTGDTQEERQYNAFVGGVNYVVKENPKQDYETSKILEWGKPSHNQSRFSGGSSYTPAEWDALLYSIEDANPITGRDEYRANWRKFIVACNKELPVIPVYSNNYFDIYTTDLENFNTNARWEWSLALPLANWKK